MIVTKVKGPLLRQRQPGGKLFAQDIFERANLLIIVDSLGCAELAQMFLIEIVQHGEILAGIAAAELKYLSLIVALMLGFAACCTAS